MTVSNFNINNDAVTLLYPIGEEYFSGKEIIIRWEEPTNIIDCLIWYEIFITDNFYYDNLDNFIQIATIPMGTSSFTYTINKNLKGDKCRVGIRIVNHEGKRGKMVFSASNFSILNNILPSPAVIKPIKGDIYFSYLPFIFDFNNVLGRGSHKSYYQIYCKSEKSEIDWFLLKGDVRIDSEPFSVDISSLPSSADYLIRIEMTDGEDISLPLFIENLTFNNANYFLLDTDPPVGRVNIQNNNEYINTTTVILKLDADDEITEVKDYQIEQEDIARGTITKSNYFSYAELATWDILGGDGEKLLKVRYRDYGDNIIQESLTEKYFRTYKNLNNRKISAILSSNDDIYMAFEADDDNVYSPQIYKNQTYLVDLAGVVTAISDYNNVIYIGIKNSENKGTLQRLSGGSVTNVISSSDEYLSSRNYIVNSLYSADSVINCMCVYNSILFMGLENGELISFNGSLITSVYDDYKNKKSIKHIFTDRSLLFAFFENSMEILIVSYYDGNYSTKIITLEN